MSNRFFEPLRRIPQKIQNIGFVQKFQDKIYRPDEMIQMINSSSYGMMSEPSCLDYDPFLSLLAIGTKTGEIHIYGAPGISFFVNAGDVVITHVKFIPCEGRLIVLCQDNCMIIFSLDAKVGKWSKSYSCYATVKPNEYALCMCYSQGIIYVGLDTGNVHQYPTRDGKICVGTEEQRQVSFDKVLKDMSFEDRDELDLISPIINIEVDREGEKLLIGYESGTIGIASISSEIKNNHSRDLEKKHSLDLDKKDVNLQSNTPNKIERSESNLLRKSRTMTMNLKNSFIGDNKVKEILYEPFKIPIPPVPVVEHFFSLSQKVTSVSWFYPKEEKNSVKIVSSYDDGSFRVWNYIKNKTENVEIVTKPENHNFPYGPMPCNSMEKILYHNTKNGECLRIFSGGLAKNVKSETSITIFKNTDQFGFGFASKIIDFILVPGSEHQEVDQSEKNNVESSQYDAEFLFVLTEKEFYVIDLLPKECKVLENPYLSCLDFSPITCVNLVDKVDESLIKSLVDSNSLLDKDYVAFDKWPIVGGSQALTEQKIFSKNHLLFLGHEDGCVSMWQLDIGNCMRNLGVFFLSDLYSTTQEIINDNWPFFKKIGMSQMHDRIEMINESFEPNCHAVRTIDIDVVDNDLQLIIGSDNGHVSMWSTEATKTKFEPDVCLKQIDLSADSNEGDMKFENNTPSVLPCKEGVFTPSTIASKKIQPVKMFQMLPVSAINKVIFNSTWNLIAIATDYGFALVDNESNKIVGSMFSPKSIAHSDTTALCEQPIKPVDAKTMNGQSKGMNLKSSIRSSFKKIKKTKSPKEEEKLGETEDEVKTTNGDNEEITPNVPETIAEENGSDEKQEEVKADESAEKIHEEENVQAKSVEKVNLYPAPIAWQITTILLSNGPLKSVEKSTPVLIVGTGCGRVLVYDIEKLIVDNQIKDSMILCKELHLQHGAPVVDLYMIDQKTHRAVNTLSRETMKLSQVPEEKSKTEKIEEVESKPDSDNKETEANGEKEAKETEPSPAVKSEEKKISEINQELLVVSEEQIKIFNFTTLLPKQKYKFIDRSTRLVNLGISRQASFSATPTRNGTLHVEADESKQEIDQSPEICIKKKILSACIKELPDQLNPENLHHYIVLNLADGNVVVHSLPYLRRQAKQSVYQNGNSGHVSACHVKGIDSYVCLSVVNATNSQLIATEFIQDKYKFKAQQTSVIQLPEWSRPNLATVITEAINKTLDNVNGQLVKPVEESANSAKDKIITEIKNDVEKIGQVIEENIESGKRVISEICGEMNDSLCKISGVDPSVGDITMDTVREYVQTDGVIKIKTSESSIEKRTTIKNGDISTLVRETEIIDGKIVKDDITKTKSASGIMENGTVQEITSN